MVAMLIITKLLFRRLLNTKCFWRSYLNAINAIPKAHIFDLRCLFSSLATLWKMKSEFFRMHSKLELRAALLCFHFTWVSVTDCHIIQLQKQQFCVISLCREFTIPAIKWPRWIKLPQNYLNASRDDTMTCRCPDFRRRDSTLSGLTVVLSLELRRLGPASSAWFESVVITQCPATQFRSCTDRIGSPRYWWAGRLDVGDAIKIPCDGACLASCGAVKSN
jgi:hypothetical protein